jgi:hypothetical protein
MASGALGETDVYETPSVASIAGVWRVFSRSRASLDTSLAGMMLPQGGDHEQTEARPEVSRGRGGGVR